MIVTNFVARPAFTERILLRKRRSCKLPAECAATILFGFGQSHLDLDQPGLAAAPVARAAVRREEK